MPTWLDGRQCFEFARQTGDPTRPIEEPSPVPDGSTKDPRYAVPAAGTRGTEFPWAWPACAETWSGRGCADDPSGVGTGGREAVFAVPGGPLSSDVTLTGADVEGPKVASPL